MTGMFQSSRIASGIEAAHASRATLPSSASGGLELKAFENASGDFAKDRRIVDDEHLCH
jgi:hypothetical protein